MIEIPLNHGYTALIDEADYNLISLYKWFVFKSRNTVYARANNQTTNKNRKTILMHRIILGLKKGEVADHKDGNGLNNQRNNIRIATRVENGTNKHARWGLIPYKGVVLNKKTCRYNAKIAYKGKEYHIGYYASAVYAALAYDQKAKQLHGEFAQLNFPDSWFDKT